jgi:hypothetical protein
MGNIALVSFITFYLDFFCFVYIIVSVFLRFRFGCAMLFVLLASYGWRKIDFLKPLLVKFYNVRRFFLYITEFRFFGLILSVGLSLGSFITNCLNMQPGLTSFSPIVSIPPFCVHNEFSVWLVFLHIVQRSFFWNYNLAWPFSRLWFLILTGVGHFLQSNSCKLSHRAREQSSQIVISKKGPLDNMQENQSYTKLVMYTKRRDGNYRRKWSQPRLHIQTISDEASQGQSHRQNQTKKPEFCNIKKKSAHVIKLHQKRLKKINFSSTIGG